MCLHNLMQANQTLVSSQAFSWSLPVMGEFDIRLLFKSVCVHNKGITNHVKIRIAIQHKELE